MIEQLLSATARGLAQGSIYTLLGLGFVIVFKATAVVNFAQPSLMILGGFYTSYFAIVMGLPFWLAVVLAMLVTAAVSAAVERTAMRPMVGEPVFAATMVTVGIFIVLQVIVNDLIGVQIRQVGDPWGLGQLVVGDVALFQRDLAAFVITAVVVAVLGVFFRFTRTGLAMRATALDQEAALAQGVPVGRVFMLSWALAGGLSALAGMFVGTGGVGIDQTTALVALKALPAIILGGLDSIPGAIIGGLVIGLAEAYTKTYQPEAAPWLGSNFDQVVPYVVMLVVLLVRPYGLFGTPEIERV